MTKFELQQRWYQFGKCMCRAFFYPLYRIRAFGTQNVPKEGPILLLSNHQSFFDPILCQIPLKRDFYCVARDTLYKNKLFGAILLTVNTIPIKRGQADLSAMKTVISKIKQGWGMCLFPEATRTSNGKIADIKPGLGLISRRTGAKVVPVVIDGAFECWPRHKKFPSLGRIGISYGEPITSEKVKELGDREFARFLTNQLREMQHECRIKLGREPFDYSDVD